jgi:hypothetical protein
MCSSICSRAHRTDDHAAVHTRSELVGFPHAAVELAVANDGRGCSIADAGTPRRGTSGRPRHALRVVARSSLNVGASRRCCRDTCPVYNTSYSARRRTADRVANHSCTFRVVVPAADPLVARPRRLVAVRAAAFNEHPRASRRGRAGRSKEVVHALPSRPPWTWPSTVSATGGRRARVSAFAGRSRRFPASRLTHVRADEVVVLPSK